MFAMAAAPWKLDPDLPAIRFPEGYQKYTDPRLVQPIHAGARKRSERVAVWMPCAQFARVEPREPTDGAEARVLASSAPGKPITT